MTIITLLAAILISGVAMFSAFPLGVAIWMAIVEDLNEHHPLVMWLFLIVGAILMTSPVWLFILTLIWFT